jgi:superfamily II DNA/RNA helicase
LQRLVALIEKGGVDLSTVQHLIIDEADRLFDDGCAITRAHAAATAT